MDIFNFMDILKYKDIFKFMDFGFCSVLFHPITDMYKAPFLEGKNLCSSVTTLLKNSSGQKGILYHFLTRKVSDNT